MGLRDTGSAGVAFPGLDAEAKPSLSDVLVVRAEQAARLRDYLASMPASDVDRPVEVLDAGTVPIRECTFTVFEEEFWHNRYALRDLEKLEQP
jgi:hypothetical protein